MTWITTEDGTPLITEDTGRVLITQTPPPGPTMPLGIIIPAYPYQQYADDGNVVAFFTAYNTLAQSYLDWFNNTPLAVWTLPSISGPLLDWIAQGIYDILRPVFSSQATQYVAGLASASLATIPLGEAQFFQSGTATVSNDDYYKRVITWWNYLGQGRYFNVQVARWRVARFLYGVNGGDVTIDQAQTVHIQAGTVPSPAAPTLSSTPGGALAGATYAVRQTYVTPEGESLAGLTSTETVAPNNLLVVDAPVWANGAESWNVYVGEVVSGPFIAGLATFALGTAPLGASDSIPATPLTKQNGSPIDFGTNWTEPTSGLIVGDGIPTADTSNSPTNYIITVPNGIASTYFEQAINQGLLAWPFMLTASVVIHG